MKKFFFYTYVYKQTETSEPENRTGAVNLDRIVRIIDGSPEKGSILILDDLHKEMHPIEKPALGKNSKPKMEYRNVDVVSQIFLNEEDTKRFRELLEIK